MAKKENNLVSLAKGGRKPAAPAKKPATRKPAAKAAAKPKTAEEERDLKAKAKVEELLGDIELTPKKKEELLEFVDDASKGGQEWLEEQVTSLSEVNEGLRAELAVAKEDYKKIFEENKKIKSGAGIQDDGTAKTNVIKLFIELQDAFIAMGKNPQGVPNLVIYPVAFLNKLLVFFPFLKEHKKF